MPDFFGLELALINRVEGLVPRTLQKGARYQIGEMVLLRRGKKPDGPEFQARTWLGTYKIGSVQHPIY